MSKETYVLTGKHRAADGTLMAVGDTLKLTPEQAQALVGKVELLAAREAADKAENQSVDERVAGLTAEVEKLRAENTELKSRLDEYEDDGDGEDGDERGRVVGDSESQSDDDARQDNRRQGNRQA